MCPIRTTVPAMNFAYDLAQLLRLRALERALAGGKTARLELIGTPVPPPRTVGVLSGSFNPLTRGHTALLDAALHQGVDAVLLLLPLRAVDKEAVTRASAADRALVLLAWAARNPRAGVALTNRGLYVDHAAMVGAHFPHSNLVFLVGHDKIVQIFDPRYYAVRDDALRLLFRHSTFRVAPRQGHGDAALQALLAQPENRAFADNVLPLAVDADVDTLSSTRVREAAATGAPWSTLAPRDTVEFVRDAQPYAPASRLPDGEEIDRYGLRTAVLDAIASGRLDATSDAAFAALCRMACADDEDGRRLRRQLRSLR